MVVIQIKKKRKERERKRKREEKRLAVLHPHTYIPKEFGITAHAAESNPICITETRSHRAFRGRRWSGRLPFKDLS